MLVFEKNQDYYKVIRDLNKDQKVEFVEFMISEMKFNKLDNFKESDLYSQLNDGFIGLLLNKDGYIQIDNYIYKVDPKNEITAVILATEWTESVKKEMDAGVYTNKLVRAYSIGDEVISMVETNTPPSNAHLFCGESGAGGRSASKSVALTDPSNGSACYSMDCTVEYFRAGIYFSLYAKNTNRCPTRMMYWHKTPAAYKVKCGYTYGPSYQWDISSGAVGSTNWVWKYYFYQNIQPLNAYWLRVVFMAKDAGWIGNPNNPSADLTIRVNM